jgi:hypothetical protein
VRAGYVAPTTRKKVEAAPPPRFVPEPDLLWVAPPVTSYGRHGSTHESVAHYAGVPCGKVDITSLGADGMPAGWGRIVDPKGRARLDNGERLQTTDGADLVAVGMCPACLELAP